MSFPFFEDFSVELVDNHMQKQKGTSTWEINSEWFTDLNVGAKAIKLKKKIEEILGIVD